MRCEWILPTILPYFVKIHSSISLLPVLNGSFPSSFLTKILYALLTSPAPLQLSQYIHGAAGWTTASAFRPVLGLTQPPIQWIPGVLSLWIKRPGREVRHSHPSSAEVKNVWSSTPTLSIRLHGVVFNLAMDTTLGIFLFTTVSRTALGPTLPPIQWVPCALSLGVKRPGRESDHSPHLVPRSKSEWSYTSTTQYAFMALCLVKHKDDFIFTFYILFIARYLVKYRDNLTLNLSLFSWSAWLFVTSQL
jgi:hypothetical protein